MRGHVLKAALVIGTSACLILAQFSLDTHCAQPEESDTVLRENLLPAQQGDAQAQLFVGYLYETGQGVELNYTKAAQWYRRAADQGNTIAQCQLGNMYRLGKGVSQSFILAYMWFDLASKGGSANAKALRRIVASKMSPAEIAEAKRLLSVWNTKDN